MIDYDEEDIIQADNALCEENTIGEILRNREARKRARFFDSVFLDMPEMVLISVLMEVGSAISTDSIAKEYLKNKPYYDRINSAQIEK